MTEQSQQSRCDEVQTALLEHSIEGCVPEELRGHVAGCAACSRFVDQLRRLRLALQDTPEPRRGLDGAVLAYARARRRPGLLIFPAGWRLVCGTAAAAAVLLVAVTAGFLAPRLRREPERSVVAEVPVGGEWRAGAKASIVWDDGEIEIGLMELEADLSEMEEML
ncbi:MAG: hypothetical protein JXR37_04860 [Kiritimatiellae bacterium]|nr:hypothetical protein [Kiritimatiellia bacterium]